MKMKVLLLFILMASFGCNRSGNVKNDVTPERYNQTVVGSFAGEWLSDEEEIDSRDDYPESMTFRRQFEPTDWSDIRQCPGQNGGAGGSSETNSDDPVNTARRKTRVQGLLIMQESGDYELVNKVVTPLLFGNELECLMESMYGTIEFDASSEDQEFQVGDQTGTLELIDNDTFIVRFGPSED